MDAAMGGDKSMLRYESYETPQWLTTYECVSS